MPQITEQSRQALAIGIGICLITVMMLTAPRGIANMLYFPVEKRLEYWQQHDGRSVDDARNEAAIGHLKLALQWDPANADILATLGVLLDRRTLDKYFWESSEEDYRAALDAFRQVARARPASPWVWIDIALLKAKLGEIDAVFEASLIQAIRLGPWEPLANVRVASLALAHGPRFSPKALDAARRGLERGYRQQPQAIMRIARTHGKVEVLCRLLPQGLAAETLCRDG